MDSNFKNTILSVNKSFAKRLQLKILQVNVGNKCNQKCAHCHIGGSPEGTKVMSKKVINDIIDFLNKKQGLILDITGGCPELNPDFKYLIEKARPITEEIIVRTNLTILLEETSCEILEFYKKHKVHIIASMPCYTEENVNKQRGNGVFEKSIKVLKLLNKLGYGVSKDLTLDLVYNPGGAFLPGDQSMLEADYKKVLNEKYKIIFNHLLTITNAPINRFEKSLKAKGNFDEYMKLLVENFNKDVTGDIMCHNLLSVGWDGALYDCDFNQALGLALKDVSDKSINIANLNPEELEGMSIIFENHCFCCTAGSGSSCCGSLKK